MNEQLQGVLNSRITIEQAKGMIAERESLDMDDAFTALRNYAQRHDLRLTEVAHSVISNTLAAPLVDRGSSGVSG